MGVGVGAGVVVGGAGQVATENAFRHRPVVRQIIPNLPSLDTVAEIGVPFGLDVGTFATQFWVTPLLLGGDVISLVVAPHIYLMVVIPAAYAAPSTIKSEGSSGCNAAKAGSSGTISQPISVSPESALSVDGAALPPPPLPEQAARNIEESTIGNRTDFLI